MSLILLEALTRARFLCADFEVEVSRGGSQCAGYERLYRAQTGESFELGFAFAIFATVASKGRLSKPEMNS